MSHCNLKENPECPFCLHGSVYAQSKPRPVDWEATLVIGRGTTSEEIQKSNTSRTQESNTVRRVIRQAIDIEHKSTILCKIKLRHVSSDDLSKLIETLYSLNKTDGPIQVMLDRPDEDGSHPESFKAFEKNDKVRLHER